MNDDPLEDIGEHGAEDGHVQKRAADDGRTRFSEPTPNQTMNITAKATSAPTIMATCGVL